MQQIVHLQPAEVVHHAVRHSFVFELFKVRLHVELLKELTKRVSICEVLQVRT